MPKMKTHSRAKKTFRVTGSGKIKRAKAYKVHILTKKSPKRRKQLGKSALVHKSDTPRIKLLLAM
ncbi:MAG: 50S ribosomal protein L35 [Chitinophagales bacterium]